MHLDQSSLMTILVIIFHTLISFVRGQRQCIDENDCPGLRDCKGNICVCERANCELPKVPGDRCLIDADCQSNQLMCYGKNEVRSCRCRKMYTYDMKFNRCLKDDSYVYDPVQNFIIPAIIVMSVGAMVYLGVKLFCNCGKMWRRRQSEISRDLEAMAGVSSHQQPTWIASYRVFSQISNSNQHTLHPAPCMGLFVPGLTSSPPPYEEALKHKVILSSVPVPNSEPPPGAQLSALPGYPFEPPPPLEDVTLAARTGAASERDQTRPMRYYPGEGNPQIPALWNSGRDIVETHNAQLSYGADTAGQGRAAAAAARAGGGREPRAVRTMPRPRRYLRPMPAGQPP